MPCKNRSWRIMTLLETGNTKEKDKKMEFDKLFKDFFLRALEQDRVTTGVFNCAKQLQMYPDRIMYCVMPVNKDGDDSSDIQHVLLKAYCHEQRIRIIYVESSDSLNSLVGNKNDKSNDYSCLLIKKSRETPNHMETKFFSVYRELLRKLPCPIVQVPQ